MQSILNTTCAADMAISKVLSRPQSAALTERGFLGPAEFQENS